MQTSPVQTHRPEPDGFTLVEVLVALSVAVVLVYTVCQALITSLHSEDLTRYLHHARFIMNTEVARARLGIEADQAPENWVLHTTRESAKGTGFEHWTVVELIPLKRTSLALRFAVPAEEGDE